MDGPVLGLRLLLPGWLLAGWLLLRGRVLAGAVRCATELMGRSELGVARLLTQGVLPTGAVIRTCLVLATVLALSLLGLTLLLADLSLARQLLARLLLGVPELTSRRLGVVGLPAQTVMLAGAVALSTGILACGVTLSLGVLGVGWLMARSAVHARAGRMGGGGLLRVCVLGRAVLAGRGLTVGGPLLRLRVPARAVLAAWVLSVGVLGGRRLITGQVLDGGDELTNAELAVALLARLVVPDIVMVQVGCAALSRGERTRLSVPSGGGLPVGRLLIRPVLRLPLLLAGLLLRGRVLARFELRVTRLLEPASLLLRLFIVAGAGVDVRGLLV